MTYNDLIFTTYFTNAIHSAIVVDDDFPTYDLLVTSSLEKPEEKEAEKWDYERSRRVYKTFNQKHIPCDIESDVTSLHEKTDRLRKSDLVVLDYQLIKGDNSGKEALKIIQQLSQNEHFNIVIVNTNSENLNKVWTEIALTMRNDNQTQKATFDEIFADDAWIEYEVDNLTEKITTEAILKFIANNNKLAKSEKGKVITLLKGLKVPAKNYANFPDALIYKSILNTDHELINQVKGESFEITCNCNTVDNIRWILNDKAFVVVMKKPGDEDDSEKSDPENLISNLRAALEDWNPSPIQLLMSNFQNTVEQGSLAFKLDLIRSQKDQAAWLYQVISKIINEKCDSQTAFTGFNNSISETVKDELQNKTSVKDFQQNLLTSLKLDHDKLNSPFEILKYTLEKFDVDCAPDEIIKSLNYNLCCLPGKKFSQITTGTIFKNDQYYWVCTSPACDLEPNQQTKYNEWLKDLFPNRPMVALRLHTEKNAAMKEATHGNLIFADDKILGVFDKLNGFPRPEIFIFDNKVEDQEPRINFSAYQLKNGDGTVHTKREEFIVVDQLRPEYASRLLQKSGVHMSRIGVDFENFSVN